mgnify:CR=1 FL=1
MKRENNKIYAHARKNCFTAKQNWYIDWVVCDLPETSIGQDIITTGEAGNNISRTPEWNFNITHISVNN